MSLADEWVAKQGLGAPFAIILALGEGHHVRSWLQMNPDSSVTVIEPREELSNHFRALNQDLIGRVEILKVETIAELMNHNCLEVVSDLLPPVMCFRPSFGDRREFFEEAFRLLTGRSRAGLEYFLGRYGANCKVTAAADDRLLTIKDLGVIIDTEHPGHPLAGAVRILRELVV